MLATWYPRCMNMDEMEQLRHEKMLQMMKRIEEQKKAEESKKVKENKEDQFLKELMMPDAYQYYKEIILPQRPHIAMRIVEVLQYIISSGALPEKVTKEEIIFIDRRLSGIGPSIKIKRPGKEFTDIASELRKNK
jgi:DNA-binding TFAR19-related protein (PDSD5 family)